MEKKRFPVKKAKTSKINFCPFINFEFEDEDEGGKV